MENFQAKIEQTKDIIFMGDWCPKFVILCQFLHFLIMLGKKAFMDIQKQIKIIDFSYTKVKV